MENFWSFDKLRIQKTVRWYPGYSVWWNCQNFWCCSILIEDNTSMCKLLGYWVLSSEDALNWLNQEESN